MSKERLEEIKEYFGFWMNNDISREWSLSSETIDNLKYLIEQAERANDLEVEIHGYKARFYKLEQQNKRYREAIDNMRLHAHYPELIKQIYEALEESE